MFNVAFFSKGNDDVSEQENNRYVEAKFYPTLLMDEDGYTKVDERYRFLQSTSNQKTHNENCSPKGNQTFIEGTELENKLL